MPKSQQTNAYHWVVTVSEWMRKNPNSPTTEKLKHVRSHDEMVDIFTKDVLNAD